MKDMHGESVAVGDLVSVAARGGCSAFKGTVRKVETVPWAKGLHAMVNDSPSDDIHAANNMAWVGSKEIVLLRKAGAK